MCSTLVQLLHMKRERLEIKEAWYGCWTNANYYWRVTSSFRTLQSFCPRLEAETVSKGRHPSPRANLENRAPQSATQPPPDRTGPYRLDFCSSLHKDPSAMAPGTESLHPRGAYEVSVAEMTNINGKRSFTLSSCARVKTKPHGAK